MNAAWHQDPKLKGRFRPEAPDELQVIVHEGSPGGATPQPELLWVRIFRKEAEAYAGILISHPVGLQRVAYHDAIFFAHL